MKQDKKRHLYICGNCDHVFYMKKIITDRLVECDKCAEKAAYFDGDFHEDDIDIVDSDDNDMKDALLMSYYEHDDQFDYSEL